MRYQTDDIFFHPFNRFKLAAFRHIKGFHACIKPLQQISQNIQAAKLKAVVINMTGPRKISRGIRIKVSSLQTALMELRISWQLVSYD